MANVGTPKFYVDHGLWLNSMGLFTPNSGVASVIHLNPSNIISMPDYNIGLYVPRYSSMNYVAFLGHEGGQMYPEWRDGSNTHVNPLIDYNLNVNGTSWGGTVAYSGFSIFIFTDVGQLNTEGYKLLAYMDRDAAVGAISVGSTYTMPNSPDLSLTMSREYGGVKHIETKGGASLSNAFYTKPPKWGGLGAWELSTSPTGYPPGLSRSGRRVWDLSFSYLDSSDVFGSNQSQGSVSYTTTNNFEYNILTDDNFFSQVIHKTGGQLPFIFQPDKDNNNPDQFAICKFDMKSFQFEQVANGVYNVKLKIREVW